MKVVAAETFANATQNVPAKMHASATPYTSVTMAALATTVTTPDVAVSFFSELLLK